MTGSRTKLGGRQREMLIDPRTWLTQFSWELTCTRYHSCVTESKFLYFENPAQANVELIFWENTDGLAFLKSN